VHCFICCALLLLACIKNGTELLRTECISGSLQLFTDAGQYAIRFGDAGLNRKFGLASDIDELHVVRQLSLPERAVALALAVSLDCDYFSKRGGWGLPFLIATE
jgi:hypothetical protein